MRTGRWQRAGSSRDRGHAALATSGSDRIIDQGKSGRFYPGYTRATNRWIVRGGQSSTTNARPPSGADHRGGAVVDFAISIRLFRVTPARCRRIGGSGYPCQRREICQWRRRSTSCMTKEPRRQSILARPIGFGREQSHTPRRSGPLGNLGLHICRCPKECQSTFLRRLKSDLLGWCFWHAGCAPAAQYLERQREVAGEAAPLWTHGTPSF